MPVVVGSFCSLGTLSAFVKTAQVPNCLWSGHCFGKDAQSCGIALAEGRGGTGPKDA